MSDLIVTLGALIVAGGFGYLYYRDINQQFSAAGQKPIGTVVYDQNTTQRRFNNRVVWQQVGDNTPLYNLDSIRTAGNSQAVIRLVDGTRIVMRPNTLITLDWGVKAKTVNFLSGSITAIRSTPAGGSGAGAAATKAGATAAPGPSLVIRSGKSQVAVSNATVNLQADGGNKLAVTVAGGKASLISGGTVQMLSAAQVANVDTANGRAQVSTVELLPTAPVANAVFVTSEGQAKVPFAWKSNLASKEYAVQVAASPSFAGGVHSVQTTASSLDLALGRGTHFWRISAAGASSPAEQLTVLTDSPLSPLAPLHGAVYSYDVNPPLVLFSWTASKIASGYELQISSDSGFTNVIDQLRTGTSSIAVNTLKAGIYYWRVRPLYDFAVSSTVGVSQVASFRIVQTTQLKAAQLVSPVQAAVLNAITVQSSGILFNWRSDNTIAEWSFLLSGQPDMSAPLASVTTPDNYYLMRAPLHPGRYYWRVAGRSSNGVAAPPSRVRSFTVSLENAKITLESPRLDWNYDQATVVNVPVVWKSNVKGNFEVDLSTRPDFSTVFEKLETTFDNATFGTLPAGTYFWHVRLIGRDGSALLSSGDGSFTVLPSLLEPVPISPAQGRVLRLVNPKQLTFRWDGDPRSRYYDFALYLDLSNGKRQEVARARDLTTNEFVFRSFSDLSQGSYTWVVAGHDPAGYHTSAQATLPVSADFSIASLRIVLAPQLLSPADGATVDGVAALDRGLSFSWSFSDPNGTARVQVSTDPSFTRVLHALQGGVGASTIRLSQLLPGTYYWRVEARSHDGIDAPPSTTNEFTVAPLPPLAQPATVSPASGESANMWDRKALTLSWSPVQDASGYILSLTNASTGAPVFSDVKTGGNIYSYSALQNLDVGPFKWKLQAYQVDESGRTVRTSAPLEINFNIVLGNKIGTPQVKAPSRVFVH